ncbi:MAG: DUF3592 domain-containing protein [Bacteroidetes bacterium]|nr:DUF3592 domain-containing protein [Bacteroidota bacterium]
MESIALTPYIFILAGIVMILVPFLSKPTGNRLKSTGERCEGVIFELGYKDHSGPMSNDSITKDKITIRFVTQKLEWITEDLNTDFMVLYTNQFKEGDKVTVIYDPNNPKDFTIETKQTPKQIKIILSIARVVFISIGIYKLLSGS